MINREITYERNLTGSYIRIAAALQGEFDEKILLNRPLKGLVPMEKVYFNNSGQYLYNITGLQPLETYWRVHEPDYAFVEKMMFEICNVAELMEWNLINSEMIQFDPEFIFVSNSSLEISFMVYPGTEGDGVSGLRHLMEYILTKINHKDEETVQQTYALYDCMLVDGYSLWDLKEDLEHAREKRISREVNDISPVMDYKEDSSAEVRVKPVKAEQKAKVQEPKKLSRWKLFLLEHSSFYASLYDRKNRTVELVYPDEKLEEEDMEYLQLQPEDYYPTVCISMAGSAPEGILIYEGTKQYKDIVISEPEVRIGKGQGAQAIISSDTISHVHAKITKEGQEYFIEDMNSTNGTFLNDEMLPFREKKQLKKNDQIRFADIRYRFS